MESNYRVTHPVVYVTFIRTEIIKNVFNIIKLNQPRVLYIFSDGPRSQSDLNILNTNRQFLKTSIDWDCDLNLIFLDHNLGPFNIWKYACDLVFQKEESMIYLLEDLLPSNSFFRFCDELLDYYKDDESIYAIGGHNYLESYEDALPNSYFFSQLTDVLGFAIWKRTYNDFLRDYSIVNQSYERKILYERIKKRGSIHWFNHLSLLADDNYKDLTPTGEEFDIMGINSNILKNRIAIVSTINLIKHIGLDSNSTNYSDKKLLTKRMLKLEELEQFEHKFPLVHPKNKILDYHFDLKLKERFKSNNYIMVLDKLERIVRVLLFGGYKVFLKKFRTRLHSIKSYELKKKLVKKTTKE